jgi:hypothetical protein
MGFPDTACVAFRLAHAVYGPLFEEIWGEGSLAINFPPETEQICANPGGAAVFGGNTTPIPLSPTDRTHANTVYDHWAQSIDSYEQLMQVSAFSSKFDAFLAGKATLTDDEMGGFKLFNGKGNCNSCHVDGRGTTLKPRQHDTSSAATVNPLFTCFGSANEGLPLNPRNAFHYQTTPDSFGFIGNPYGAAPSKSGAYCKTSFEQWEQHRRSSPAYAKTRRLPCRLLCYHARLGNVKNVSADVSERQALSNLIRFSKSRDPIIKYDSLSTLMSPVDVGASLAGSEHCRDVPLFPIVSGRERAENRLKRLLSCVGMSKLLEWFLLFLATTASSHAEDRRLGEDGGEVRI